jgi:hypothetical protein
MRSKLCIPGKLLRFKVGVQGTFGISGRFPRLIIGVPGEILRLKINAFYFIFFILLKIKFIAFRVHLISRVSFSN